MLLCSLPNLSIAQERDRAFGVATTYAGISVKDDVNWTIPYFQYDSLSMENKAPSFNGLPGAYFAEVGFASRFARPYRDQAISLGFDGAQVTVDPKSRILAGYKITVGSFAEVGLLAMVSQGESYKLEYDDRVRNFYHYRYRGPFTIQLDSPSMFAAGYMGALKQDLGPMRVSLSYSEMTSSKGHLRFREFSGLDLALIDREYLEAQINKQYTVKYFEVKLQVQYRF